MNYSRVIFETLFNVGMFAIILIIYDSIKRKIYKKRNKKNGIEQEKIRVERIFNDMFEKEKEKLIKEMINLKELINKE